MNTNQETLSVKDELLANTGSIIRPFAERIIQHTMTIFTLDRFFEQEEYVAERIKQNFLTPVEAEVINLLLDYKEAELTTQKGRPQAERVALRRIMGTQTLETLKELRKEFAELIKTSTPVFLAFEFKDAYINYSEATLRFFDLVRVQAFQNAGLEVEIGNWTK